MAPKALSVPEVQNPAGVRLACPGRSGPTAGFGWCCSCILAYFPNGKQFISDFKKEFYAQVQNF